MKYFQQKRYQRGQILLIVVLVMVATLTIGLSVATRVITNSRTTKEEASSEHAFSAAEAGIERSLISNLSNSGTFANASYTTSVSAVSGVEFLLNGGSAVLKDDSADIWLSDYPNYLNPWTGNLTIYWGKEFDSCDPDEASNTMAALEIILISGTKASPKATHYVLDPCVGRASNNNFEISPVLSDALGGQTFAYKKTIVVSSGLILRIVPLYAPTLVGARGCDASGNNCANLPTQGTILQAVGQSENTVRRIVSFRGYPKLPTEIFPFVLFVPR
jgi:hypothetical protein